MDMMRNLRFVGMLLIVAGMAVLSGCGSSKRVTLATEQAALSGAEESRTAAVADSDKKSSDEDEVMRLLGLGKTESGAETKPQPSLEGLENDRQRLEEALKEREIEIATLKAELAERDRQLNSQQPVEAPMEAKPAKTYVASSGSYQERYDKAYSLYNSNRYQEALQEFEALLSTDSNHKLAVNCQYWIGECYYGMRAYNQAIIEFEKVFTFSNPVKNDDAQLKLGLCYTRIGNVEKAKAEFQKVIDNYPGSEFIPRAQYYLQTL